MIRGLIEKQIEVLLPLYANGRISPAGRWLVETWLRRGGGRAGMLDSLTVLRDTLGRDPGPPAPTRWPVLDVARVSRPRAATPARKLGWGLVLLLLIFSWVVLPPAVELEWSVEGSTPAAFRVYRASDPDLAGFQLVKEIPAGQSGEAYRFRDLQLVPGQDVVYRIEAVSQDGLAVADETIVGDASLVLPGQLAMLMAIGIALYGAATYLRQSAMIPPRIVLTGS